MSESRDAEQAATERRQRAVQVQSGAARAAVLGINDGLVTNTALILGVVGAAIGVGGTLGYLSNGRVAASALRQLLIVALASAVTFLIGELLGVAAS